MGLRTRLQADWPRIWWSRWGWVIFRVLCFPEVCIIPPTFRINPHSIRRLAPLRMFSMACRLNTRSLRGLSSSKRGPTQTKIIPNMGQAPFDTSRSSESETLAVSTVFLPLYVDPALFHQVVAFFLPSPLLTSPPSYIMPTDL